jgi:hypothetical protein
MDPDGEIFMRVVAATSLQEPLTPNPVAAAAWLVADIT